MSNFHFTECKGPMGSIPDFDKLESERIKIESYKHAYASNYTPIAQKMMLLHDSIFRNVSDDFEVLIETVSIPNWDSLDVEERRMLVAQFSNVAFSIYHDLVNLIMEYLPGRTFLNSL